MEKVVIKEPLETEFGQIPKHWEYMSISKTDLQIGDGNYSSKYPRQNELLSEGIPFISSNDLSHGKISANGLRYISIEHHNRLLKGHIKHNDVLMVVRGNGVGQVALVGKEFNNANLNAQMAYLGRSKKIDGPFLYYLLSKYSSDGITETVVSGSAQPQITIGNLKQLNLIIPPLPEQKAIAAVLSSLDDKIDLLHRQNKTLEGMAEALFRQWFVEGASNEWENGCLGDLTEDIKDGINPSQLRTETKYIGLEHIDRKNIALKRFGSSMDITSNKHFFLEDDILFGKLRPYFHKVCFAPFPGVCSTDILVIRPKMKLYLGFCLFAFFQNDVVEYANLGSGGTRMPRTDWNTLKKYPIGIPDDTTLKRFNNVVLQLVQKVKHNGAVAKQSKKRTRSDFFIKIR